MILRLTSGRMWQIQMYHGNGQDYIMTRWKIVFISVVDMAHSERLNVLICLRMNGIYFQILSASTIFIHLCLKRLFIMIYCTLFRQNRICANILIREKDDGQMQSGILFMTQNSITTCLKFQMKWTLISLDLLISYI